ncbi:hypothetical protein FB471_0515 [Amycolatopsis cihanbeyliensis]|uniref:Uncharacterized protein n=2 Tax=Amycolatopsis cihanbeyliensis TaxID=1128664 RepID=A0A542DCS4_AMYCI|nr:hypothetical protein FB471_0515 [Amycolatopsis cihanbeyliensis]
MGSGDQSTTLPRAEPGREHGAAAADGGRWGIPSPRVEDEEFEPTIIRGRE